MKRLSRASVINDIEFIVNRHKAVLGERNWKADGLQCQLESHTYTGNAYSFHTDVLTLETATGVRPKWKVMIVTQSWRGVDGETMHSNQFLKLLSGRNSDVTAWVSANRDTELTSALRAEA